MKRGAIHRAASLVVLAVAIGAPLAGHLALVLRQGYGIALLLAAAQAVAAGIVLWTAIPGQRWLGPATTGCLLAALALGAWHSPAAGLLAAAGTAHAILYTSLLVVFAATLRPGRISLVTMVASRLNPRFHPGMIPYTRAVTVAWCVFFALQVALSAILLAVAPELWRLFVTTLHVPLVLGMAVLESLVRRWRWRHEHYTGLLETLRGVRKLAQRPASSESTR